MVTVGNTKLTVVGVFEEKGLTGNVNYNAYLFTPITIVFEKFTPSQFARIFGNSVRVIYVEVADRANLEDTIYQIELLLAKRHGVSLGNLTSLCAPSRTLSTPRYPPRRHFATCSPGSPECRCWLEVSAL